MVGFRLGRDRRLYREAALLICEWWQVGKRDCLFRTCITVRDSTKTRPALGYRCS